MANNYKTGKIVLWSNSSPEHTNILIKLHGYSTIYNLTGEQNFKKGTLLEAVFRIK